MLTSCDIVCAEEIWTEVEDWDGRGEGEVIMWSLKVVGGWTAGLWSCEDFGVAG